MIRNIVLVGVVAGFMLGAPSPSDAQAYCRCECHRVPGGRVCHRVCSYPQPRYVPPEPSYRYVAPRRYEQSFQVAARPPLDLGPFILIGIGVLSIAALLAALTSTTRMRSETPDAEAQAIAAQEIADKLEVAADKSIEEEMQAAMRKADAYIAARLAKHREGDCHE